jgi:hypothetical protein
LCAVWEDVEHDKEFILTSGHSLGEIAASAKGAKSLEFKADNVLNYQGDVLFSSSYQCLTPHSIEYNKAGTRATVVFCRVCRSTTRFEHKHLSSDRHKKNLRESITANKIAFASIVRMRNYGLVRRLNRGGLKAVAKPFCTRNTKNAKKNYQKFYGEVPAPVEKYLREITRNTIAPQGIALESLARTFSTSKGYTKMDTIRILDQYKQTH